MIGTVALIFAVLVASGATLFLTRALRGLAGSPESQLTASARAVRAVPAVLAAALAFVAADRIAADASYEIGGGVALGYVAIGLASGLSAMMLLKEGLAKPGPYVAALVAVVCAALLAAGSPIVLAQSACACTTAATPYVAPTLIGLDAPTWAALAAVGTPVLLLVSLLRRP